MRCRAAYRQSSSGSGGMLQDPSFPREHVIPGAMEQISEDPHICSVATQTPNPGLSALPQPYSRCAHPKLLPARIIARRQKCPSAAFCISHHLLQILDQETLQAMTSSIDSLLSAQNASKVFLPRFLVVSLCCCNSRLRAIEMTNVDPLAQQTYIDWR